VHAIRRQSRITEHSKETAETTRRVWGLGDAPCPAAQGVAVEVTQPAANVVRVTTSCRMQAATAALHGASLGKQLTTTYTVYGSGDIVVRTRVACDRMMPWLPRVGVRLRLDSRLQHVAWLGCDSESYPDRKVRACVQALSYPLA